MRAQIRTSLATTSLFAVFCFGTACGNADFDAVKEYKAFLEDAKPSLQAMNRVREELMQVDSPDDTLSKFRDELLPEVKKLSALASEQASPEVKKLKTIHETLQSVLSNYANSTQTLVDALDAAKGDEDREKALLSWGEDDEKFGSDMASLVQDIETYLDKLRKGG